MQGRCQFKFGIYLAGCCCRVKCDEKISSTGAVDPQVQASYLVRLTADSFQARRYLGCMENVAREKSVVCVAVRNLQVKTLLYHFSAKQFRALQQTNRPGAPFSCDLQVCHDELHTLANCTPWHSDRSFDYEHPQHEHSTLSQSTKGKRFSTQND